MSKTTISAKSFKRFYNDPKIWEEGETFHDEFAIEVNGEQQYFAFDDAFDDIINNLDDNDQVSVIYGDIQCSPLNPDEKLNAVDVFEQWVKKDDGATPPNTGPSTCPSCGLSYTPGQPHNCIDALKAELDFHKQDVQDACGELLVKIPEPGSEMSKVLRANSILRQRLSNARQSTSEAIARWNQAPNNRKDLTLGDHLCEIRDNLFQD